MNLPSLTFLVLCIALSPMSGLFAQEQKEVVGEAEKVQTADRKQDPVQQQSGNQESKGQKQKAEPKAKAKAESKQKDSQKDGSQKDAAASELLDVEMTDIYGNKVNLKKYEGKVVLVVNVASKCGFTGQYRPLQLLHKRYKNQGLEVVAFPCNQFGKQEPASETVIDAFCKKRFGIEFDLYAKVDVKGDKQAELFKRLTDYDLAPAGKGAIYWNFEKFIIGKDGKPIARFRSNVSPDDERIVSKLKAALAVNDKNKEDAKKEDVKKKEQQPKAKSDPSKKTSSDKPAAQMPKSDLKEKDKKS